MMDLNPIWSPYKKRNFVHGEVQRKDHVKKTENMVIYKPRRESFRRNSCCQHFNL